MTPKRHHRESRSPQDILRTLSRLLANTEAESNAKAENDQINKVRPEPLNLQQALASEEAQEEKKEKELQEQRGGITQEELLQQEITQPINERNELYEHNEYNDYDFEMDTEKVFKEDQEDEDEDSDDTPEKNDDHNEIDMEIDRPDLTFSDIAMPEGIMPEYLSDPFIEVSNSNSRIERHLFVHSSDILSTETDDNREMKSNKIKNEFKEQLKSSLDQDIKGEYFESSSTDDYDDDLIDNSLNDHSLNEINSLNDTSSKIRIKSTTVEINNDENHLKLSKRSVLKYAEQFTDKSISNECIDILNETTRAFFYQLSSDLKDYNIHSKKNIIKLNTVLLLLKRQRKIKNLDDLNQIIEQNLTLSNNEFFEIKQNLKKLLK